MKFGIYVAALVLVATAVQAGADQPKTQVTGGGFGRTAEDVAKMPWEAFPNKSLRKILWRAKTDSELTTFIILYPENEKFSGTAHRHNVMEQFTVLKGVAHIGFADCADPAKARAYGPGSVITMPAGTAHFASFEGETILQVTHMGPEITAEQACPTQPH